MTVKQIRDLASVITRTYEDIFRSAKSDLQRQLKILTKSPGDPGTIIPIPVRQIEMVRLYLRDNSIVELLAGEIKNNYSDILRLIGELPNQKYFQEKRMIQMLEGYRRVAEATYESIVAALEQCKPTFINLVNQYEKAKETFFRQEEAVLA